MGEVLCRILSLSVSLKSYRQVEVREVKQKCCMLTHHPTLPKKLCLWKLHNAVGAYRDVFSHIFLKKGVSPEFSRTRDGSFHILKLVFLIKYLDIIQHLHVGRLYPNAYGVLRSPCLMYARLPRGGLWHVRLSVSFGIRSKLPFPLL